MGLRQTFKFLKWFLHSDLRRKAVPQLQGHHGKRSSWLEDLSDLAVMWGCMSSAKWDGAKSFKHLKTINKSLKLILKLTRIQCKGARTGGMCSHCFFPVYGPGSCILYHLLVAQRWLIETNKQRIPLVQTWYGQAMNDCQSWEVFSQ